MVGLPGSGKTTYAEANFRTIVSPDRIRWERYRTRFDRRVEPAVWRIAHARTRSALTAGRVVCFDATSLTRRRRRPLLACASAAGRPAVAFWVRVDPAAAWARNVARPERVPHVAFRQMVRALQPPSTAEGFAAVVEIAG